MKKLNQGLWRESGFGRKLTLVSAPAGFGKTTLVATWAKNLPLEIQSNTELCWLSLYENDNDLMTFLSCLLEALRKSNPTRCEPTQKMLQKNQPPQPEVFMASLAGNIAKSDRNFILVLDDYHLIHSASIHLHLTTLLAILPASLHIVLTTRKDPPFAFSRLRVNGQMLEIRQADLQFDILETESFFRCMRITKLSSSQIADVHRKIEGWIAGLQLLAISLNKSNNLIRSIEEFRGSNQLVTDYLLEEVFQHQTTDLQQFLMQSSLLDTFSSELCDQVFERKDSQIHIRELIRLNLFAVPLDDRDCWWRYQHLFRQMLRERMLRSIGHEELEKLHQRACNWYRKHGYIDEAISHALAGSDWERAVELIVNQSVSMLKQGKMTTLLEWFLRLPPRFIEDHPRLMVDFCWTLSMLGKLDTAKNHLEKFREILQKKTIHTGKDNPNLEYELQTMQAFLDHARLGSNQVIANLKNVLHVLPRDAFYLRSCAACTLGSFLMTQGDFQKAQSMFIQSDHDCQIAENLYARQAVFCFLSDIDVFEGKLQHAKERLQVAVGLGGKTKLTAQAYIQLAELHYEWNNLDESFDCLQVGIELAKDGENRNALCRAYGLLARTNLIQNNHFRARQALDTAHELIQSAGVDPWTQMQVCGHSVRIFLSRLDFTSARYWAEQLPEIETNPLFHLQRTIHLATVKIAQNQMSETITDLESDFNLAFQIGLISPAVKIRLLQSICDIKQANALRFLSEALTLAKDAGLVRTLLDTHHCIRNLIEKIHIPGLENYTSLILKSFQQENQSIAQVEPGFIPIPMNLIEPLSEREMEVLRLLMLGLPNRKIAESLFISVGTVKTHVHNILGKLNAQSRLEAIMRIKKCGIENVLRS